jgi:hypothetical protein
VHNSVIFWGGKEACAAWGWLFKVQGFLDAPIAQLDRASDYGSKNTLFAIFIIGHQSASSITASTTYAPYAFAMVI